MSELLGASVGEVDIEDDTHFTQEVLEQIFHHLDFKHLKLLRLVSKKWNKEACRGLRKSSCAFLSCQKQIGELERILNESKELELPNVLKELHIVNDWKQPSFREQVGAQLLQTHSLEVTQFGLKLTFPGVWLVEKNILERGLSMLSTAGAVLTHLVLDSYFCEDPSSSFTAAFPNLGSLSISHQDCEKEPECLHSEFVAKVINASPKLQQLSLSLRNSDSSFLDQVVSSSDWRNLEVVKVFVDNVSPDFISVLKKAGIIRLKSLSIDFCWNTEEGDYHGHTMEFMELLGKFSYSLENLSLTISVFSYDVLELNFPHLPHLTSLHVDEFKIGSCFLERTPALKKFTMDFCFFNNELLYDSVSPVQSVSMVSFPGCRGSEQENRIGMTLMTKQFPNASAWRIAITKVAIYCELGSSLGFYLGRRGLERIELRDVCSVEEEIRLFTGVLNHWRWEDVREVDDMERGPNLRDLSGLKELSLPENVRVTEPMLKHGLSRLSNLRLLEFYWNDSLTPDALVKHLPNLSQVLILNCCQRQYSRIMEDLFSKSRAARCGCNRGFASHFG